MWGRGDSVVPPLSNTEDPTKSRQTNEEFDDDTYEGIEENFYNTARNVTDKWGQTNGCDGQRITLHGATSKAWDTGPYSIPYYGESRGRTLFPSLCCSLRPRVQVRRFLARK